MRAPKGFGRRYFTLQAITAYSSAAVLQGRRSAVRNCHTHRRREGRDSDDPPPEEPAENRACFVDTTAPCHCDCFFRRRTRLALLGVRSRCFNRCHCRFYSFRRSGIHPPLI